MASNERDPKIQKKMEAIQKVGALLTDVLWTWNTEQIEQFGVWLETMHNPM